MARQLPSLNALRVFEAAARHSSFTRAAEELYVTHAAVSRQVRELERWLGTELFVRSGRGVRPTEAGVAYQHTLTRMFDELQSATASLRRQATTLLHMRIDLAFASWLVPRLGRFRAAHPDVDLAMDSTYELFNPRGTRFELGIQYGMDPDWEGVDFQCLAEVRAFPVCSPGYVEDKRIETPADLLDHTLLHEESRSWWREWLQAVGVNSEEQVSGPMFDETHLVLLAAEGGQGFALADDLLAADPIAAGRLVRVLDVDAPAGGYYLVRRPDREESRAAKAFREWLRGEL